MANPTPWKVLKLTGISILGIMVGIPALLVAINAFDQDLKPEALRFADLSADNVPDHANGFYAWVGLTASASRDPHTAGVAIVSRVNDRLASGYQGMFDEAALSGPESLWFTGNPGGLCGRDHAECLARYRANASEIRTWLRANRILLDRYHRLFAYPQFRETVLPRINAPVFSTAIARTANLARARNAMTALDGNPSAAVRNLQADNAYWRRILGQSRGLINRMIAVAMIQGNSRLLSEIIATRGADPKTLAFAAEAVAPLSDAERDLTRVYQHEFGYGMHVFSNWQRYNNEPCAYESWVACAPFTVMGKLLYQPNATINEHYERFARLAGLSRLPAADWHLRTLARRTERADGNEPFVWHLFYNPVGKILSSTAEPAYESYSARIHNLDVFLRLVSLQILMQRAGVRGHEAEKYLNDADPALRNPYTGAVIGWDSDRRALYTNGFDDTAEDDPLTRRIEVRLSPSGT